MGKQHHHVDAIAPAERLDRRAAGVARGRPDNGRTLAAYAKDVVHEPRQQLHRQVLEGEGGPVEQLGEEAIGPELHQRDHHRVAERVVGFPRHAGEVGLGDRLADERADRLHGDLGVGAAGPGGDRVRR